MHRRLYVFFKPQTVNVRLFLSHSSGGFGNTLGVSSMSYRNLGQSSKSNCRHSACPHHTLNPRSLREDSGPQHATFSQRFSLFSSRSDQFTLHCPPHAAGTGRNGLPFTTSSSYLDVPYVNSTQSTQLKSTPDMSPWSYRNKIISLFKTYYLIQDVKNPFLKLCL